MACMSGRSPTRNQRPDMFLREYIANGMDGAKAYRKVYGPIKTANTQAYKLLARPKVRARYQQMMKKILNRADITEERILGKYEEAFDLAQEQGKPSDMIAAATSQAKLVGMLRDRIEAGSPGDFDRMESISDVLAAIAERAGPDVALKISDALGIARQIEAQPVDDLTELAESQPASDAVN